jgi:hypothetical protein
LTLTGVPLGKSGRLKFSGEKMKAGVGLSWPVMLTTPRTWTSVGNGFKVPDGTLMKIDENDGNGSKIAPRK